MNPEMASIIIIFKIREELNNLLEQKRNESFDTENKPMDISKMHASWKYALWDISFSDLKQYIKHQDKEIRLKALALIVESKRSTLRLDPLELDLIVMFLNHNLKERFEFVHLIEKALKRIKSSVAVMRRELECGQRFECVTHVQEEHIRLYQTFLKNLREILIVSPDATYCHRRYSLEILLVIRNLLDNEFTDISWNSEQAQKVFDLLLLDTYESNKEMAFNLLSSLDPDLLQLNNEDRVWEIITVAIELGNSIRPIDSVTAIYMLKIALLSPIVEKVLSNRLKIKECPSGTTDAVILQLILFLLNQLEKSSVLAKENIVLTVTKHSLYGYLYCLRGLLRKCNLKDAGKEYLWQCTIAKLISVCFDLNEAVSVIVNNSSPEGHLPMDLNLQTINEICDSSIRKDVVTPQMVLLCSWRTVKEVSLLFGLLATESSIRDNDSSIELLTEEQIIKIGEHLVSLLSETKHRGAFEQAHVGFSQLCKRLWKVNNGNLNHLPKMWLHQSLLAITGFMEGNSKLCATRRSAGVPFMIQALVSSEPRVHKNVQTTTFHSVMKILLSFTSLENEVNKDDIKLIMYGDPVFFDCRNLFESFSDNNDDSTGRSKIQVNEIKTHALNILRAIFRHSKLGEIVHEYVADGLIAAFKSIDGLTWAERNAGTLLFSALIIRIFGVQRTKDHINLSTENKMDFRVFFTKYPKLLSFVLDELTRFVERSADDSLIKSNVQSILLLLSRLYLSDNSSNKQNYHLKIDTILLDLISKCAKSSVYETRNLAARALVSLLTRRSVDSVIKKVMQAAVSVQNYSTSFNLMHGYLLQILEIITQFGFFENWSYFFEGTRWIIESLEHDNQIPACFPLATVYINICHEIYREEKRMNTNTFSGMLFILVPHLLEHKRLKQGPAREMYKTSLYKFVISNVADSFGREYLFSTFLETISFRICLIFLNTGMQTIAWSAASEIFCQFRHTQQGKLLRNIAVDIVRNSTENLFNYNPELQDAIFDFLYNVLEHDSDRDFLSYLTKHEILMIVLSDVRCNANRNHYSQRDSYLRLLGKSCATAKNLLLMHFIESNEIQRTVYEVKGLWVDDIYNRFCDNSWIASLSKDFRKSVWSIMFDLLPFSICIFKSASNNIFHTDIIKIQWWTALLLLLVDNNSEVRYEALICLDKINLPLEYFGYKFEDVNALDKFFTKFCMCMTNETPMLACIGLFYWSISLLDDTEEELDDTDVFNKCINYDFFEPLEISHLCVKYLKKYFLASIDETLPHDAIDWINRRLCIDEPYSISFRTLVKSYKKYLPVLEDNLQDIINPIYKSKLLRILSYKNYLSICNS